jgi:hypothetical protein
MRVIDLLVHSAPTIQAFDPYDGVQDQIPLTFADGMAFYSTGGMTADSDARRSPIPVLLDQSSGRPRSVVPIDDDPFSPSPES